MQTLPDAARARFVWIGALLAALVAAAVLLAPSLAIPWPVVLAAFLIGTGRDELELEQIVPFALRGIAGAAAYLHRAMPARAGIWALLATCEPHLGLPLLISLAVWTPRARPVLGCGVALLGLLSVASSGLADSLEYARAELPLHALAESSFRYQDSLTYALTMIGVPERVALGAGSLSFIAMLVAGVALAGRLARRTARPGLVAIVPPAFVLLGGTFIKEQQLIVAVPLGFALIAATTGRARALALAVFFLVTFAWQPRPGPGPGNDIAAGLLALLVTAAALRPLHGRRVAASAVALTVATAYSAIAAFEHGAVGARVLATGPSVASFLAQVPRERDSPHSPGASPFARTPRAIRSPSASPSRRR